MSKVLPRPSPIAEKSAHARREVNELEERISRAVESTRDRQGGRYGQRGNFVKRKGKSCLLRQASLDVLGPRPRAVRPQLA